jgi:hypothetical protein
MRQEVVFLRGSPDDPNLSEMNEICQEMANQGLSLVSGTSCQGNAEDGTARTVGLWLFFSEVSAQSRTSSQPVSEEDYSYPQSTEFPPTEFPRRWLAKT